MNRQTKLARLLALFAPVLFVITIVGFWQTYYASTETARAAIHVHNFLMMAWMFLLILQPTLIVIGLRYAHRQIGRATFVIAPLMVLAGLLVTREFLQQFSGQYPPVAYVVFSVSVISITQFAVLYVLAIYFRRRVELHARFMVATGLIAVGAALLRVFLYWVPWTQDFSSSSTAGIAVVALIATALTLNDYRLRVTPSPFLVPVGICSNTVLRNDSRSGVGLLAKLCQCLCWIVDSE